MNICIPVVAGDVPLQAGLAERFQVRGGVHPLRQFKQRQVVTFAGEVHIAAFGNGQRILQRVRNVSKQRGHFMGAAQVVRIVRHAHPVMVGKPLASLHAQEDILQFRVLLADIVHIIRGDERHACFPGQCHQPLVDPFLVWQVVAL